MPCLAADKTSADKASGSAEVPRALGLQELQQSEYADVWLDMLLEACSDLCYQGLHSLLQAA